MKHLFSRTRALCFVSCTALAILPGRLVAQSWSLVRSLDEGLVPEGAHVALEVQGDLLFVAVSGPSGGTVTVHQRHQGGLEQWGVLGTVHRDEPWFGRSLAVHGTTLAVGSPGAEAAGPFTGETRLYSIDLEPGADVLQPIGSLMLEDATSNDLFGYDVHWLGDTLAVSAVGRAEARSLGEVFLFTLIGGDPLWSGSLPSPLADLQVPFIRWFGACMANAGDRMAVAAPFSGFETSRPQQNIGALAIYRRDNAQPSGWVLDTAWADLRTDTGTTCSFQRMELGRWGLAFSGGQLIMDHSRPYTGVVGNDLEPWLFPDPAPACATCGSLIVQNTDGHWELSSAAALQPGNAAFTRAAEALSVAGDALFAGWFDPVNGSWMTEVHRRDQGGPGAWGVEQTIPASSTCDRLDGPIAVEGGHLARSTRQVASGCGVPEGFFRLGVEVFGH